MITSEDVQELIAAMQSLGSTIEETGTSGAIDSGTESMREGFAKDIAKYIDIQADRNAKSLSNPATGGGVFDQLLEGTRNIVNELQSINKNLELNKGMSRAATMIGSGGAGAGVGKALSGAAGMAGGLLKLLPSLLNPAGIAAIGGMIGLGRTGFDISKWMGNITGPFKGTEEKPMSLSRLLGFENDPALEAEGGTKGGRFKKGLIERAIESLFGYLGINQDYVTNLFDFLQKKYNELVATVVGWIGKMSVWFDTFIVDALKEWYEGSSLKVAIDSIRKFIQDIFGIQSRRERELNGSSSDGLNSTAPGDPLNQNRVFDPSGGIPGYYEPAPSARMPPLEEYLNRLDPPPSTQSQENNSGISMTDDGDGGITINLGPGLRELINNSDEAIEDGIVTSNGKVIRVDDQDSLLALKPNGPIDKMLGSMDNTDVIQAINDLQDITTQLLTQQIEGQVALAQIVAANTGGDNIINAPTSVVNMDNSTNDNIVLGTMKSRIYG